MLSLPFSNKALPSALQLPFVQLLHIDTLLDVQIHPEQRFIIPQVMLGKRLYAGRQSDRLGWSCSFGSPAMVPSAAAASLGGSVSARRSGSRVSSRPMFVMLAAVAVVA